MHVPSQGVIRPQPESSTRTEWLAGAKIPTRYGEFDTHVFRSSRSLEQADGGAAELPQEHVALVFGDVRGRHDTLVRVHSECITSEVFGSLQCDCQEQLDAAIA